MNISIDTFVVFITLNVRISIDTEIQGRGSIKNSKSFAKKTLRNRDRCFYKLINWLNAI
jgi:hypothetical protein